MSDNDYIFKELFEQIRDSRIRYNALLSKKHSQECLCSSCKGKAISSHSISKSVLERIAENGHIVYPVIDVCDLGRTEKDLYETTKPNLEFKKVGIGKADTFNGFCRMHDNAIFEPIDNYGIRTVRDIFLQLYRTACKYYFQNKMVTKSELETFHYEYHSNEEFENSTVLPLAKIMIFLEDMLCDFPELERPLENIDFSHNIFRIDPWSKKLNLKMEILYKRISPCFDFALEKDFTLGLNGIYHHCLVIIVPEKNYSNLIILCHPDVVGQLYNFWGKDIEKLNMLESVLMSDSFFYLKPSVISSWSAEKLKFITEDFFFCTERKFLQEYDVSIFDELRKKLIATVSEDIRIHEEKKLYELPLRKAFSERYSIFGYTSIKDRQKKILATGNKSGRNFPIGALRIIDEEEEK